MELWARNIASSTTIPSAMHSANSAETNIVLRELFELLEDYAPIWYTEDLHNRTAAALSELQPAN
jgi:hypothetical protein